MPPRHAIKASSGGASGLHRDLLRTNSAANPFNTLDELPHGLGDILDGDNIVIDLATIKLNVRPTKHRLNRMFVPSFASLQIPRRLAHVRNPQHVMGVDDEHIEQVAVWIRERHTYPQTARIDFPALKPSGVFESALYGI